jgi:hypothetical protein
MLGNNDYGYKNKEKDLLFKAGPLPQGEGPVRTFRGSWSR